jgi:prophage tail gpP-like protein
MPNPAEIAAITIDGQIYNYWQSVTVERSVQEAVSYATLECAEVGPLTAGFAGLKIGTGDTGTVTLAGQPALIGGLVDLRQVYYDKDSHGVQVRITSRTQQALSSTVAGKPGQYTNSTFQQIIQAVCKGIGINTQVIGNPPGADKVFLRVSEHIGETCYAFMERLGRQRDLHVVDDVNGNLNWIRGGSGNEGSTDPLVEGQNILSARVVMENNPFVPAVTGLTQNIGSNQTWASDAQDVSATVPNPLPATGLQALRRCVIAGEQPGDKQDCQMRASHELAVLALTSFDAVITVPGWLMSNGQLWISMVGGDPPVVTLNSPMVWPSNANAAPALYLKGVKHMQDNNEGTRTELSLCLKPGLGGPATVGQPSS